MTRLRVAVVGGGISGLTLAWRIGQRIPQASVEVFEEQTRWGGAVQTRSSDGFLMEGGPDSLITDKPAGLELCRELGLGEELLGASTDDRRAMVVHRGRLVPIPEGFRLLAPTRLWPFITTPIISPLGKLRIGLDLLLPRGEAVKDETLASFVGRRLGREALEKLAQPLIGGIYGGDPERLSLHATMPRFIETERRDRSVIWGLVKGIRAARAQMAQKPSWEQKPAQPGGCTGARYSLFVSLQRGLGSIIEALLRKLPPESLHLGRRVTSIKCQPTGKWVVEYMLPDASTRIEEYDCVAVAMPAWRQAAVLSCDAELASLLGGVRYSSSAVVNLAFRREQIRSGLNSFGFVVPRIENRVLLACTYASVKYGGRAPEGTAILRCFCGGANREADVERPAEELQKHVMADLRDIVGLDGEPLKVWVARHNKVMPQYEYGHLERLERIAARMAALPGLFLCGNGSTGVGVPDCARIAKETAQKIADYVEGLTQTEG